MARKVNRPSVRSIQRDGDRAIEVRERGRERKAGWGKGKGKERGI